MKKKEALETEKKQGRERGRGEVRDKEVYKETTVQKKAQKTEMLKIKRRKRREEAERGGGGGEGERECEGD